MSRQKPVTLTLHTALRYRLAIDMRKAFPTRPGIGAWDEKCRGLIKAPRRLGRFQPCDMRRFPSLVMTLPFTCSMLCPAAHVLSKRYRAWIRRVCRIEVGVTSAPWRLG